MKCMKHGLIVLCLALVACGPDDEGVEASSTVSVQWTYPILMQDAAGATRSFPTYLAHLLGGARETHALEFETACADIRNDASAAVEVELRVDLVGYSSEGAVTVSVEPGQSKRQCVNPTPALDKLYALTAPANSQLSVRATDSGSGAALKEELFDVVLQPGNDVFWSHPTVKVTDMYDLSSVFVTPHDASIEALLTEISQKSVFPDKFGASPYERSTYSRSIDGLGVGQFTAELVALEPGESFEWLVQSVTGGSDKNIDVYLLTLSAYTSLAQGKQAEAVRIWSDQKTGARDTFTSEDLGLYVLVFFNSTDNYTSRTLQWTRTNTREDAVRDVIQATFMTLRKKGIVYNNIPTSYFEGAQHIKRPSEVLATRSANCIDGSLLFASVAELVGMEPVLIIKPGHAYMGIRSAPGSSYIWPIETTMTGSSNDYSEVWYLSLTEYFTDISAPIVEALGGPVYIVDIAQARQAGLTPTPL